MIIHGIKGRDFNTRTPLRTTSDGSIYDFDRVVGVLSCRASGDTLTYNSGTGLVTGVGRVNSDDAANNVTSSSPIDLSKFVITGMGVSGGPVNDTDIVKMKVQFESEDPIFFSMKVQHGIVRIVGIKVLEFSYVSQSEELVLYGHLKK